MACAQRKTEQHPGCKVTVSKRAKPSAEGGVEETGRGRADAQARPAAQPESGPVLQRPRWRPGLPSASALPGRPLPGTQSIHASVGAKLRQASLRPQWAGDVATPWPWVPARRCPRSASVLPSRDSVRSCWPLRSARPAVAPGVRASYSTERPVAPPSQTAPARRRATPSVSAGTAARRDLAEAPAPGGPAAVYFRGTDSRAVTWNLASRCSDKCFRRTWSQKLFRWTSN